MDATDRQPGRRGGAAARDEASHLVCLACALALGVLAACGPSGDGDSGAEVSGAGDGAAVDVGAGVDTVGVGAADASADAADAIAPGGIGWPCKAPTDCDVPLCLDTPDGKRCSTYCGDGACPDGWSCEGQTGGGDATFFCVAAGGLLCRPCDDDQACKGAGHAAARCVRYDDDGGFCGLPCASDAGCPAGTACRSVKTTAGASAKQCVVPAAAGAGFGVCACSPAAKADGLTTTCAVTTGSGPKALRCKGERRCDQGGLSACEVISGAGASCVEIQCVDELTGLAKADGVACDDGRACTAGDVCKAGVCTAGTQVCPCEPGFLACPQPSPADASNLCKGPPYCAAVDAADVAAGAQPFACLPNPGKTKICDDSLDGACSKNACLPLSGACTLTAVERVVEVCDLPPAPGSEQPSCRLEVAPADAADTAATACDDGLACSIGDVCKAGQCVAELSGCACTADVDCIDDGDLCNGKPFCDKSGAIWQCATNPATVVSCDSSGDSACLQTSCAPATGACVKAPAPAGAPCSDGVACTAGDICDGKGACTAGAWVCCKADADCAAEEDGDFCNGTLYCDQQQGACLLNPQTKVTCPSVDDTACRKRVCQPKTGACALQPTAAGVGCNDGNPCTAADVCDGKGACAAGTNTCVCQNDADCVGKDDGDLCNGTLYCDPFAGPNVSGLCKPNPATVVVCATVDDDACRKNVCAAKTGVCAMVDLPAATTCDADGTACTAADACDGKGACVAGAAVCACATDADCAGKKDANPCLGALFCDKSGPAPTCQPKPGTAVTCPKGAATACKPVLCDPETGACVAKPAPLGAPCDDGVVCTGGDGCDGLGACKAGASVCGCKVDADCAAYDPAGVGACDVKHACVGAGGGGLGACVLAAPAKDAPCDDGDACTANDVCKGGACKGEVDGCDDANVCTIDACDAKSGCNHKAVALGVG